MRWPSEDRVGNQAAWIWSSVPKHRWPRGHPQQLIKGWMNWQEGMGLGLLTSWARWVCWGGGPGTWGDSPSLKILSNLPMILWEEAWLSTGNGPNGLVTSLGPQMHLLFSLVSSFPKRIFRPLLFFVFSALVRIINWQFRMPLISLSISCY